MCSSTDYTIFERSDVNEHLTAWENNDLDFLVVKYSLLHYPENPIFSVHPCVTDGLLHECNIFCHIFNLINFRFLYLCGRAAFLFMYITDVHIEILYCTLILILISFYLLVLNCFSSVCVFMCVFLSSCTKLNVY